MSARLTEKAWKEFASAENAIVTMETSSLTETYKEGWADFLHHIERCFYKLLATYKISPHWEGWAGHYKRTRREDPLLNYISAARGAEEHGIADIVIARATGVSILRALNPATPIEITLLTTRNDNIHIEGNSNYVLKTHFTACLLPITYRGQTTAVPLAHLGGNISSMDLHSMARLALNWHRDFLVNADDWFRHGFPSIDTGID